MKGIQKLSVALRYLQLNIPTLASSPRSKWLRIKDDITFDSFTNKAATTDPSSLPASKLMNPLEHSFVFVMAFLSVIVVNRLLSILD